MLILSRLAGFWLRAPLARTVSKSPSGQFGRSARRAPPLSQPAGHKPPPPPPAIDKSAKTIAVVAPDNLYRRAMQCVLRSDGYGVETYPRAEDFVAGTVPGEFDCLVIDIDLPEAEVLAQAHIDLAARLRDAMSIILIAPRNSMVPGQLGLPAIRKCSPDSALLILVHAALYEVGR